MLALPYRAPVQAATRKAAMLVCSLSGLFACSRIARKAGSYGAALRAGSFRWFPYRPQSGLTWNALRAVFSTDCRSLGGEPVARVVCPLGPSAEAALRLARKMNAKFGACATSARQKRSQLSRRASEPDPALANQPVTRPASTEAGGTSHPAFGPGTRIGVARLALP